MAIQERRVNYLPREYPWAYEAYEAAIKSHWRASEVEMSSDVRQWNYSLTQQERNAVGRILSSFTYMEQGVGDYWTGVVGKCFPKPEIFAMASAFGVQEANHAEAYNHLSATLGLDEYKMFQGDADAIARVESVLNYEHGDSDLLTSLATFSGLIEGVSLYSSFAVLMSFCQPGVDKLPGLGKILGWSISEERYHSAAGIRLFQELAAEMGGLTDGQKKRIYDAARSIVSYEESFINGIFEEGDLPSISKHAIYSFILDRANLKLSELGLKRIFKVDTEAAVSVSRWFYSDTEGLTLGDFFHGKNAHEYSSKADQNFTKVNYADLLK
jgi:ribonucleoside-diphosphate reductase beta chain